MLNLFTTNGELYGRRRMPETPMIVKEFVFYHILSHFLSIVYALESHILKGDLYLGTWQKKKIIGNNLTSAHIH